MTELMESVQQAWRKTLGTDNVDPEANFFESGGDSVMALSMIESLERRWDVTLPLEEFIVNASLGNLVAICQKAANAG